MARNYDMNDLKHAENNMRQLCDMVNTYSQQLGLGKKVRFEDFVEPLQAVIANAEQVS